MPKEVYVVMRVPKISEENPALTIYVDPWALHLRDQLDFMAESYTVTSGNRAGLKKCHNYRVRGSSMHLLQVIKQSVQGPEAKD